jgi:hypothetical protein
VLLAEPFIRELQQQAGLPNAYLQHKRMRGGAVVLTCISDDDILEQVCVRHVFLIFNIKKI